ncbi:MAG: SPOR domain-containing protein [Flavobacteriaceae bacterium]
MICRKTHFNHLFVNAFCFFSIITFAQEANTLLNAPEKLTNLLELKILLDAEASKKRLFTIQVHYGNFESTTTVLEEFKTLYPDLPARLVFETPNYKIRAGRFATEREALEVLTRIKRRFKAAFVLKP